MVNTLSGSVCAYRKETVKPRFIRIDEVMALLDVTQDEAMDIALAAGARYQLAKIILVHKELILLDCLLKQWTMEQKVQIPLWQMEAVCLRLMSSQHILHQI